MLSLLVITQDEADRIGRCVRSVPFAAEVIVVDSGSSDGTTGVAVATGAQVVHADWPGHVAQKNRALSLATQPWSLSLDADEWLEPEAAAALEARLRRPNDAVGFRFARCSHWLGRPMRHGRWYPDRKLRVVRTGHGQWVGDDPHDRLTTTGPVADLPGDIGHEPYRDIWEHLRTIDTYTGIHATSLHARGVPAARWRTLGGPMFHFVDAYVAKRGFRDGADGLAVAALGAAHCYLKWSRLRALERG